MPPPNVRKEQSHSGRIFEVTRPRSTITQLLGPGDRVMLSSTCTQYRKDWVTESTESLWYGVPPPPTCPTTSEVCCKPTCKKRSSCHCDYCDTSFCREHCAESVCTAEHMPATFGNNFVCPKCAPKVDSCQHTNSGCATCEEVEFFKLDLIQCLNNCDDEELVAQAHQVCENIDIMVGHIARVTNQERYWPYLLDELKTKRDYKQVTLTPTPVSYTHLTLPTICSV